MLSRIADSLFGSRYMERAEATARILDVNYYMMLRAPSSHTACAGADRDLTGAHEEFARYAEAEPRSVFEFRASARITPTRSSSAWQGARERTIRDRMSREMGRPEQPLPGGEPSPSTTSSPPDRTASASWSNRAATSSWASAARRFRATRAGT
jgi:hypothetical protein